jgi:putative phage-type endonuclease
MNINYLDDLSDLEDVLDDVDENWDSDFKSDTDDDQDDDLSSTASLSPSDEMEIVDSTVEDMYEYIEDNPTAICETDFHDVLNEYIQDLLKIYFENLYFDRDEDYFKDEINSIIQNAFEMFYNMYPRRSYSNTLVLHKPNVALIQEKIKKIKNKDQPSQRTAEWYMYRHNLITASNAYKVFENETTRNQLIYEKCVVPFIPSAEAENADAPQVSQVNVNSALHWGQKYEPISVMVYEYLYNTKVGDFGCIQHDTYGFIGASPDGINIDPNSPIYGRMLEIKNPVSREIDGVPKKEYWVQMQQQMEVCDLEECDFLETKFIEYENEDEFNKDGEFAETADGNMKGIIMYFSNKYGNPVYKYKPLHIDNQEDFLVWEEQQMDENEDTMTWIKNIYWKLDQISCVLVQRNQKWFHDNVGAMKELWEIVEKERQTGFSHREPKKRAKKVDAQGAEPGGGCLISIKKNNDVVSSSPIASSPIIKIRTESIDETQEMMKNKDFV